MKNPEDWPIYNREGRLFSFLDCTCDGTCKHRNCTYCAFEDTERGCPGVTEEASTG